MNKSKAKKMTEKLSGKIEESPMRIKLNPLEIKEAIATIKRNFDKAELVETLVAQANLYHLDLGAYKYYFNWYNNDVIYLVRYTELKFKTLENKAVRQCLVWRNKAILHASTADLPKRIFWDKLFIKYRCCVSDSQQTQDGEGFWHIVVKKALNLGYVVKLHNTNDNKIEFEEKVSFQSYLEKVSKFYGDKSFYQRYIISIEG